MTEPQKWRLQRSNLKTGPYFVLVKGSHADRLTITIGRVDPPEAEAMHVRANEEGDRLLHIFEGFGRDAALNLLRQPSEPVVDYRTWPLLTYARRVYGPWREKDRPATWRVEKHDWGYLEGTTLGATPINDVDEHTMDEFLENLVGKKGNPASPNQKRKIRNAVTACLEYAYRKKHRETPRPTWFRLRGTGHVPDLDKYLLPEEVRAILEHAPGWHGTTLPIRGSWTNCRLKYRSLFACLFGLGLRPSEVAHMDWADVDFTKKTILVMGAKGKGKTTLSRSIVPMLDLVYEHMMPWWEVMGRPTSGLCHPAQGTGVAYVTSGSGGFGKSLDAAVKAAGITKPVSPYWGRHTFATLAFAAGLQAGEVAKILRHTSPAMLQRHYDHLRATQIPGLAKLNQIY